MENRELPKVYNPKDFEDKWYTYWQEKGYFSPKPDPKKRPYTIVIPPPNVTSQLHMGHGLNNTIQDILIRWKRMSGWNALWIPGTDHAGIATQNVVEKKLAKENKTRHHYSREEFVNEVWKWKEQYGSIIIDQLKKLGCSCDWNRERFTMDEGLSHAVREVFVQFYEDGLIYKGKYIVNWCPRCGTALSQEEVDHEDINGFFYHIKYPVKGTKEYIEIATTRPETMLGDSAVAVHPKDERFKHLIGKTLILPLMNREIPVIADEYTKMEFGTGAVKVTPAHDPNDFLVGRRHHLPQINVMTSDGKMNEETGKYSGMDRFECRKKVVEELENQELFIKKESHLHSVGHCYRCNTIIEPYLSDQWFVKMKPLAKKAVQVVEEEKVRFYPEKWKKVYLHWMENIEDWCISRQIWWGHRIPVWKCQSCSEVLVSRDDLKKCSKCGSDQLIQDEDVLDTWFSSQLWPFSTLDWPDGKEDLKYFYPTNVLSTAPEILFFWVARMIMAGMYFIGDIPFSEVYLHSTVRDKQGRKMSKSLGNGIDPLEVIDKHGADALRFTIVSLAPIGLDIKLGFDDQQNDFLVGTRFANKIWNASRYLLMNLNTDYIKNIRSVQCDLGDGWILSKLQKTIEKITQDLGAFRFNDVTMTLYDFFWHDFCDWYIEISKIHLYGENVQKKETVTTTLIYVLSESLKLLHPIMPFITEEIWQKLPHNSESIMIETFPIVQKDLINIKSMDQMNTLQEAVYLTRSIRGEMNIPPDKKLNIIIQTENREIQALFETYQHYILNLGKLESIKVLENYTKDKKCASGIGKDFEMIIPLEGLIDVNKEKERLNKELLKIQKELDRVNQKLKNEKFLSYAAEDIVQKEKDKLEQYNQALEKIEKNLQILA